MFLVGPCLNVDMGCCLLGQRTVLHAVEPAGERGFDVARLGVVTLDQIGVAGIHDPGHVAQFGRAVRMKLAAEGFRLRADFQHEVGQIDRDRFIDAARLYARWRFYGHFESIAGSSSVPRCGGISPGLRAVRPLRPSGA